MATLALSTVGSFFGPIGTFVGAAIGGYIDSQFLLPALFPQEPLQGPRLTDLQITNASEGVGMKWAIGPFNRVGGTAIWMLPLKEVKKTQKSGKGGGGQSSTTYTYYQTAAIGVSDTRGLPGGKIRAIRKIWADAKIIYDDKGPTKKYKSIQIYLGNQTTPNSLIQSKEGALNTPNYNGLAYVVIEELLLTEFGNRMPNLTFLVEQESDVSVGDAIGYILSRGGYGPSEYDTSRLSDCFKGMVATGPQTLNNVINPILLAYSVGCQNRKGVLTFFNRGSEHVISTTVQELSAREDDSADRPFKITDSDSSDQPYQCTVKFVSTDIDLQQGSQVYSRTNYPNKSEIVMDLPLTLDPEAAKAIAVRSTWVAEVERKKIVLDLPPSYLGILEGDRIKFDYNGSTLQVFAASVAVGNNYRVHVEGVLTEPEAYRYSQVSDGPAYGPQVAYRPPATILVAMDCTSLESSVVDKVGVYYAVCAASTSSLWVGGSLYISSDDINYVLVGAATSESTIGLCLNLLAPGPVEVIDRVSTLTVTLYNGSLEPCTEAELLAGANTALVETTDGDWEVIGFQTVTALSSNTYVLSNLLRGRRGTEHLAGKHTAGNRFVLAVVGGIEFVERGSSLIGVKEYYKAPAVEGNLDDYSDTEVTLEGRSAKPFSPCAVTMVNVSGDYVFNWARRTKSFTKLFGMVPFTPDEAPEGYIIEVLVSPGFDAAVQRTITISGATTWTYTAAMQTADGRTPGVSACTVKIYQRSNTVGMGTPFHGTFAPGA